MIIPIRGPDLPGRLMKVDFSPRRAPLRALLRRRRARRSRAMAGFSAPGSGLTPSCPGPGLGGEPGLDLGTAIAVAFPRSPMITAMSASDLAGCCPRGGRAQGWGHRRARLVRRFFIPTWDHPGSPFAGSASFAFERSGDHFGARPPLPSRATTTVSVDAPFIQSGLHPKSGCANYIPELAHI